MPLRGGTGAVSPGLFEVLELLGRPRTIRRLETALSLVAV
jgi:hypothetical protein